MTQEKKAFAIALLHDPDDAFRAAISVFPDNPGKALDIYGPWPHDDIVKAYQNDYLKVKGSGATLPSKDSYARKVWDMGMDIKNTIDERLKALRLYGDINGMIEKPGTIINPTVQINNNKVMIIESKGSRAEWETALMEQQRKLKSAH